MEQQIVEVLRECSLRSFENMPFPQVVKKLSSVGIESYHADLFRHERTYYLSNGVSYVQHDEPRYAEQLGALLVAPELDAREVQGAVSAIQKAQIGYLEFLQRIMKAGVSSYGVFIRGRRAIYSGRTGDEHIEWFPGAKEALLACPGGN